MKSKIIFCASLALSLGLAVPAGYVFCMRTQTGASLAALIPAYIATLFLSVIFGDLVHEGAHVLVGLCCSMGVRPDKYRIFRTSSVSVRPKGARAMRARMIATSSAGVAANLLCLAAGVVAACFSGVAAFFSVLMPYSCYLLLINAVPDDMDGAKNDGMLVLELIRRTDSAAVMLRVLCVQGRVRAGENLADIPEDYFFSVPQLPEDDLNFIMLTRIRYEYYFARGDEEEAQKYLSRYNELACYLPPEYAAEEGGTTGNKDD